MHAGTVNEHAGHKRAALDLDLSNLTEYSAVRKRISRACDQCNQQRSKCDGNHPCTQCAANQLPCAYKRAHKKRGRVPKKEQASGDGTKETTTEGTIELDGGGAVPQENNPVVFADTGNIQSVFPLNEVQVHASFGTQPQPAFYDGYHMPQSTTINSSKQSADPNTGFAGTNDIGFSTDNQTGFGHGTMDMSVFGFPLGDDYSIGFMGRAPMVDSPDSFALTSPMFLGEQWPSPPRPSETLRYPVLQPILPHLESIIPPALACDLLEQYFVTATSTSQQPKNPYIHCFIFRKQSILHSTNPRPCTGALLASMLWISAQYSDSTYLTSQPDARSRVCQKLLELTVAMLKPLVHSYSSGPKPVSHHGSTQADASLGGLVLPIDIIAGNEISSKQVDNIVTYIHLATVVSASERKAASLRWWNAAWSLAREIRLGRELPTDGIVEGEVPSQISIMISGRHGSHHRTESTASSTAQPLNIDSTRSISDEDREERRRAWWVLYMMDRHLALCYNRPTFFLNKECEELLQPREDDEFQIGQLGSEAGREVRRGLDIECTSLTAFGFFLPLMVILGEILDLNHARNRPRFGPTARRPKDFSDTIDEIEQQLAAFRQSLHRVGIDHDRKVRSDIQAKMVMAYGTHIMHVLHILLTGKWDPIALLDDNDLWISSQSFVNATGHAVSAAKALADIIDYDPDLSFMPYFFGIYLLQGSFLLLLFADRLQDNITPEVVSACETIIRAHEACVSTLDTQYQRNFRRVMRSALQQLRGRMHENVTEQQTWRREILKLYRWTGDGTGLAL